MSRGPDLRCLTPNPGPHPKDRVCAEPGCITRLHTRHDGDRCYAHAPAERASRREQKIALADLMAEMPEAA